MLPVSVDKPLRDHTLLQAICRTNRPYGELKTHGLIVDYLGVFDDVAARGILRSRIGFAQGPTCSRRCTWRATRAQRSRSDTPAS